MPASDASSRKGDPCIPNTPQSRRNIHIRGPAPAPEPNPSAERPPESPRNTKSVYTITSSATRDHRKNRLTSTQVRNTTRPVTPIFTDPSAPPPPPTAFSALPTPPRSIQSTKRGVAEAEVDPALYPDANVVHHYTHCAHTSPPCTRPLNAQPSLIHCSPSGAPRSTLLGRCFECDQSWRRGQETLVLAEYHHGRRSLHLRLLGAREALRAAAGRGGEVDDDGVGRMVEEVDGLVERRDEQVKRVWRGFSARWGPGTVGVRPGVQGGRMDVMWERPEPEKEKGTRG